MIYGKLPRVLRTEFINTRDAKAIQDHSKGLTQLDVYSLINWLNLRIKNLLKNLTGDTKVQ
jgi:hypothetical protein